MSKNEKPLRKGPNSDATDDSTDCYRAEIDPRTIVRQNALDAFEVWLEPKDKAALEQFLVKTETTTTRDALIEAWDESGPPDWRKKAFLEKKVFALAEGEKRWEKLVPDGDYVAGVRIAAQQFLMELRGFPGPPPSGIPRADGSPRIGLALSGGGSKGAFTVGALKVIRQELGVTNFPVISATSTGSLIGTMLALNDWSALVDVYANVRTKDIVNPHYAFIANLFGTKAVLFFAAIFGGTSIYDTSALAGTIAANVDFVALESASTLLIYNTVDLQTGSVRLFNNRDQKAETLRKALLASSNMPVLMPPVDIRAEDGHTDRQYVDGGVREFLPLGAVFDRSAQKAMLLKSLGREAVDPGVDLDLILAISTAPLSALAVKDPYDRIVDILGRTIDLMDTEVGANDYVGSLEYDAMLKMIENAGAKGVARRDLLKDVPRLVQDKLLNKCSIPVFLIAPEDHIDMDSLTFEPERMREVMKQGATVAKKIVKTLP